MPTAAQVIESDHLMVALFGRFLLALLGGMLVAVVALHGVVGGGRR